MEHFYIITNREKDNKLEVTNHIRTILEQNGKRVSACVRPSMEETGEAAGPPPIPEDTDCILVLGGDGTLLQTARDTVERKAPLLGINLGTLGYLAEVERTGLDSALEKLIRGEYYLEERMMLTGRVIRDGNVLEDTDALNDVVIARSGSLQIIDFNIYVNGQFLNGYSADGVILSTPTGSTGYNMSAGGPIVEPKARLIVVTPICPHTVNTRSIILSAEDSIEVEIKPAHDGRNLRAEASFDGSHRALLRPGDRIVAARSFKTTQIVKLKDISFLEVLHKKMSGQ